MSDQGASTRPIGWWLKEADVRPVAAFDSALEGTDVDRRSWQVLASLSRGSTGDLTVDEARLGAADPRRTVRAQRRHGLVPGCLEALLHAGGEVGGICQNLRPGCHAVSKAVGTDSDPMLRRR